MNNSPKLLALVFAGGALGTLARLTVGYLTINDISALFVVNLLGTAFLAWFNARQLQAGSRLNTHGHRAFWGAGFSGGFTTMSGLALWFVSSVVQQIDFWGSIGVVLGQMVLGVLVYLGVMSLVEPKALKQPQVLAEAEEDAKP